LLKQMFWDNFFFPLMRSCIFKSSSWCFYTSLFVSKSDLSKQTFTLYTENEWPNLRKHSSYRRGRSGSWLSKSYSIYATSQDWEWYKEVLGKVELQCSIDIPIYDPIFSC
jgi:hypothetical protein